MTYTFTVSPDFPPDHIAGWYVLNTFLQRTTGEHIHLELFDRFDQQRAAIAAGGIDLIYANPFDAATLVRDHGFVAVARARAILSRGKSKRRPWPIHVKRPLVHVRRFVRAGGNHVRAGSHAFYTLIASILWPAAAAEAPSLAFSTPGDEGLGSYLSYQRESSREVAHPTPLMGLACLPADNVPAPLRESIAWRRMRDLVAELSGRYPVVVFDASGLLDDPDPEVLADQVDLVLVVARAEKTPVRDLKRTLNRLSSAKGRTAGVILNGVDRAFADLLTEAEA